MFYVANALSFLTESLYVRGFVDNRDRIYEWAKALVLAYIALGVGIDKPKPVAYVDKLLKYMWTIDSELPVPELPADENDAQESLFDKKERALKVLMSWLQKDKSDWVAVDNSLENLPGSENFDPAKNSNIECKWRSVES